MAWYPVNINGSRAATWHAAQLCLDLCTCNKLNNSFLAMQGPVALWVWHCLWSRMTLSTFFEGSTPSRSALLSFPSFVCLCLIFAFFPFQFCEIPILIASISWYPINPIHMPPNPINIPWNHPQITMKWMVRIPFTSLYPIGSSKIPHQNSTLIDVYPKIGVPLNHPFYWDFPI